MKNIFISLRPTFSLKREAIERLLENEKNEEFEKAIDRFFSDQEFTDVRCHKFLAELLKLVQSSDVRQKLLNLQVYFISKIAPPAAKQYLKTVLESSLDSAFQKVRFFSNVYKSTINHQIRKWILASSIGLIETQNKISLYSGFVDNFELLLKEVSFQKNEALQIWLKMIQYLQKHLVYRELWPRYAVKSLSTISEENSTSSEANALLIALLKHPSLPRESSLLLTHQPLRKNSLFPYFEWLMFGDYQKYESSDHKQLKDAGIDAKSLGRRVKISAIPRALGGINQAGYEQIAQILQIKKEEVESYVIEAIKEGLLLAKIDEFQQTILINGVVLRCIRQGEEAKLQKDMSTVCLRAEQVIKV